MKKKLSLFLALIITMSILFSVTAFAESKYYPPFETTAEGVYLINLDTNEVIYEKNSREKMYPASLTKIMTTILALEYTDHPEDEMVTMKGYIENEMYLKRKEMGGISLGGFLKGEEISLEKLLYAVMLPSANEAAMMVADYVGDGSIDYFVELMNKKAKELGAYDTNFANPHGLHEENHYTTPYDMYLITRYAMENPKFVEIVNTVNYDGGPTNKHEHLYWNGTNKLINKNSKYYSPYISGVKTGTTDEAGKCVISTASKDGYNYLMVIMGAPLEMEDEISSFYETTRLYDWVFNTFKVKTIIEKGEIVGETGLRLADEKKDHLKLMCYEKLTALIPDTIDVSSVIIETKVPKQVNAPVKKGDYIGSAEFILAGDVIGTVDLVSAESVEASAIKIYLDKAVSLTKTFWFKFVILFVIISIISYTVLAIMQNKNKKRRF